MKVITTAAEVMVRLMSDLLDISLPVTYSSPAAVLWAVKGRNAQHFVPETVYFMT